MPKNNVPSIKELLELENIKPEDKANLIFEMVKENPALLSEKEDGYSILHLVMQEKFLDLTVKLIALKSELVLENDKYGNSVVHYIVWYFDQKASALLEKTIKTAPADSCDKIKRTPLHYAALFKKKWAIDILPKDRHHVFDALDSDGKSPFDLVGDDPGLKVAITTFNMALTPTRVVDVPREPTRDDKKSKHERHDKKESSKDGKKSDSEKQHQSGKTKDGFPGLLNSLVTTAPKLASPKQDISRIPSAENSSNDSPLPRPPHP